MGGFSLWHILIFAIIVLLLFGGNRFSAMMGDVAKGLKNFKKGLSEEDEKPAEPKQIPPQQNQQPIDITPNRPAEPTQTPPVSGEDQSRH
jgi:sec-independent protein translocase protein TatA